MEQTKNEEFLNTITHGIGAVLGVFGMVLLLQKVDYTNTIEVFSVTVYGLSVIVLFLASTLYHGVTNSIKKKYYRIADHISIYILIAGTYTPVLLLVLPNSLGWLLFWVVWGITLFGTFLKLFFTGRFEVFSTLLYLVMGWLIVFDYQNLALAIGAHGAWWLFAGGFFYCVGIIFYVIHRIPYHHVIWHVFVLAGAFCHFMMIYKYVLV